MTTQEIRKLYNAEAHGKALCPAHDDKAASLSISAGTGGTRWAKPRKVKP